MANGQRVLVVDELTQTAEVLRAVLGPRGVRVEQAPNRAGAPISAELAARLSVVVVDEETASNRGFDRHHWRNVPQVFIATAPVSGGSLGSAMAETGTPTRYLSKPFHYGDLIRAIEGLIAEGAA